MIKYFAGNRSNCMVKFDTETESLETVRYAHTDIDWMYVIPEDGEITINGVNKAVKKDDVVIQFYPHDYTTADVVVVKSAEWKKRMKEIAKFEEAERKKWAEKNLACDKCCEDCCESAN